MTIELFDPADARMAEAIVVRFAVFVDEQGVPPDLELDEYDRPGAAAVHVLARRAGAVAGTGRYYVATPECVQIGRMAVIADERARGAGRAIVLALMQHARERGFTQARLDAQDHAVGFYGGLGFNVSGPEHLDAGIVHLPMRREL